MPVNETAEIILAADHPGLKPLLQGYCKVVRCVIPLPKDPDILNIEASDLQSIDPDRPNVILFSATLRNRATHVMAYPAVELTLTGEHNDVVARRILTPSEYIGSEYNSGVGIPANGEASFKLHLDTGDVRAAGYRLFLFYP